jgi:alpha/beta superfamily hydrolase
MTVAGFLIQYLNQLEATTRIDDSNQICIVLGGYSYGSLIASRLPEIPLILSPFSSQAPSPTAQEIMVTAQDLANQSNRRLKRAELGGQKRESAELMGTDPNDSHTRLKDEVPQIIQDGQIKAVRTSKSSIGTIWILPLLANAHIYIEFSSKLVIGSAPLSQIPISVSYLLISPLLPPISVLISLPLGNHSDSEDHFRKFREKPSFAIWGENDNFTSSAKLRHWAEDLNKANDTFLWIEVKGASHFWRERGVVEHLTSKVGEFVRLVTSGTTTLQKAVIS